MSRRIAPSNPSTLNVIGRVLALTLTVRSRVVGKMACSRGGLLERRHAIGGRSCSINHLP
jgi:hypothetical protein